MEIGCEYLIHYSNNDNNFYHQQQVGSSSIIIIIIWCWCWWYYYYYYYYYKEVPSDPHCYWLSWSTSMSLVQVILLLLLLLLQNKTLSWYGTPWKYWVILMNSKLVTIWPGKIMTISLTLLLMMIREPSLEEERPTQECCICEVSLSKNHKKIFHAR